MRQEGPGGEGRGIGLPHAEQPGSCSPAGLPSCCISDRNDGHGLDCRSEWTDAVRQGRAAQAREGDADPRPGPSGLAAFSRTL